jgi:hypothetical protein
MGWGWLSSAAKRITELKIVNKRTCLVVGLIATLGLALIVAKPLPKPKARAQRIQGVNNLARPFPDSFVLTNFIVTNGAPAKRQ